ncbi:hypothetical protein Q7P37_000270 [Cladosporium fusiforme]
MVPLNALMLASLACSAIAAPGAIQKRADTSKDTYFHFQCTEQTIPEVVSGGGTSSGSSGMSIHKDEQEGPADNCETDSDDGNCMTCTFPESDGLESDVEVHACWRPAGGDCTFAFSYKGHDYDSSSDSQCVTDTDPAPFSVEVDARCYFGS